MSKENFHVSHLRALVPFMLDVMIPSLPIQGALPHNARVAMGLSPFQEKIAFAAKKLVLPMAWFMQQPRFERYIRRLMWGPDAIALIESARELHNQARTDRSATPPRR